MIFRIFVLDSVFHSWSVPMIKITDLHVLCNVCVITIAVTRFHEQEIVRTRHLSSMYISRISFVSLSLIYIQEHNCGLTISKLPLSSKCWKFCPKDYLNYRFHASNGRLKVPGEQNRVTENAHRALAQNSSLTSIHHLKSLVLVNTSRHFGDCHRPPHITRLSKTLAD